MKMNHVSTAQRLQGRMGDKRRKKVFSGWVNGEILGAKKTSAEKSHLEMLLLRLNPRLGG